MNENYKKFFRVIWWASIIISPVKELLITSNLSFCAGTSKRKENGESFYNKPKRAEINEQLHDCIYKIPDGELLSYNNTVLKEKKLLYNNMNI